ncbi:MAG: hypothetical protein AAGJ46_10915 [Planctomycetota bacterium]
MLPRFTLRTAFILLTAGSLLALTLAEAVRGQAWAVGVVTAVAGAGFVMLVHAAVYRLTRLMAPSAVVTRRADSPHTAEDAG